MAQLTEQPPGWWLPAALLGACTPLVIVVGVVAIQEIVGGPHSGGQVEVARRAAERFRKILEAAGFTVSLRESNGTFIVDFKHPEVERLVRRLPYRPRIIEDMIMFVPGSASFTVYGAEANIPIVATRKFGAVGRLESVMRLPPEAQFDEFHWHIYDSLIICDVHLFQGLSARPTTAEATRLAEGFAEVVRRSYAISRSCLAGG